MERVVTGVRWYGVLDSQIIQPPYSPELNPAERVFQEVWVEGKTYGGIEEKMEAVDAYLGELESDPGRVRSLTAWSWIEHTTRVFRHTMRSRQHEMVLHHFLGLYF